MSVLWGGDKEECGYFIICLKCVSQGAEFLGKDADNKDKHIQAWNTRHKDSVSKPTLKQINRCLYENGHKTIEGMAKAIKKLIDKEELSVSEELRKDLKQ